MTPIPQINWSPTQWLTVREMARIYSRSERTIRRWCSDGTLREFRFSVIKAKSRQGKKANYIRHPSSV